MANTDPKPLVLPSSEDMRKRFHFLREAVARIEEQSAPVRAERDALVNQSAAEIAALEAQYKELEAPLFDMKMEMGDLVRLLKGSTGPVEE